MSLKIFINPRFKDLSSFIESLPETFGSLGDLIRNIRNEIRLIQTGEYKLVVKSYKIPNILNKVIYGSLRKSKAERAYEYAEYLLSREIGSPVPVAYITERKNGLFNRSYFISLLSDCPYNYYDLFDRKFEREQAILEAIAETTAKLHENNFLHHDYTGGNILFDDTKTEIPVEIIDLNRMSFKKIGLTEGCKNFGKLQATEAMLEIMGSAYAKVRGYDESKCISLIKKYNPSWK